MSDFRPRRSVLYMPGANDKALEKAKTLDADALILDLEDSVAPDAKSEARLKVAAAVVSREYGHRELVIRTNGIGTQWHADDIAAAVAAGPDAILVPKVNNAAEVLQLVEAISDAPEHTKLWAMIETPEAIRNAYDICSAADRLTVLVMGTNDLVSELRAARVPGRAPILTALSQALLAAREAGKIIIDGVYNDVKDPEGFVAECKQGFEFGFDGKTLIHPNQIDDANKVFAPSEAEVEHAKEVIAAFETAQAEGKGVITVNGKLIENLHVREAERTIAVSEALAIR